MKQAKNSIPLPMFPAADYFMWVRIHTWKAENAVKLWEIYISGKGKVAIIIERFGIIGHELRRKGFQNILKEKFPNIEIVDTVQGNNDFDNVLPKQKK